MTGGTFTYGGDMSDEWTSAAVAAYDAGWAAFVERTMSVDMSDVRSRFLRLVPEGGSVIDVGAGSGRDSAAFLKAGLDVTALEPCRALAEHVRTTCGVDVLEFPVGDLERPRAYDGAWACASLLHLDSQGLGMAMDRIVACLRPGGAFYASFKEGDGHRFDAAGRHFLDMRLPELVDLCEGHGLTVVGAWHSDPVIADQAGRRWCNVLATR